MTVLKDILLESNITFQKDGMRIVNMDKSHTILVHLLAENFEFYEWFSYIQCILLATLYKNRCPSLETDYCFINYNRFNLYLSMLGSFSYFVMILLKFSLRDRVKKIIILKVILHKMRAL